MCCCVADLSREGSIGQLPLVGDERAQSEFKEEVQDTGALTIFVANDGILVDYFDVDIQCFDVDDVRIDILSECAGCGLIYSSPTLVSSCTSLNSD